MLMFVLCNLGLRCRHDVLRVESEFLHELLQWRRGSEALDADIVSFGARVLRPSEIGGLLDRDARLDRRRKNPVPVALILIVKQLPAGHADYPCPYSFP